MVKWRRIDRLAIGVLTLCLRGSIRVRCMFCDREVEHTKDSWDFVNTDDGQRMNPSTIAYLFIRTLLDRVQVRILAATINLNRKEEVKNGT